MFIKTAIALAIVIGAVSGSLAAPHSPNAAWDVYDSSRGYVGTDPDPNIRGQLLRDQGYGD